MLTLKKKLFLGCCITLKKFYVIKQNNPYFLDSNFVEIAKKYHNTKNISTFEASYLRNNNNIGWKAHCIT